MIVAVLSTLVSACASKDAAERADEPADMASIADLGASSRVDPSPHADLGRGEPTQGVSVDAGSGDAVVELVSPTVCRTQTNHLVDCRIGTVQLELPIPAPMISVRTGLAGDCATQFDIVLSVRANGDAPIDLYPLHAPRTTTLRRPDGSVIDALTIVDASPFAGTPAYDASCRIWIDLGAAP